MSELFSVQMNIAETPNVQAEQSASTSAENPSTTENSFNSVLKQALPKENKEKLSETGSQSEKTESKTDTNTVNSDQPLDASNENSLKSEVLQLLGDLTQSANTESGSTTTVGAQGELTFDENKLTEFLNTYFASDSAKEIQQTLKDIRSTLTQVSQSLNSLTNQGNQDAEMFGGLTKNFGELQNLLTGKTGTDVLIGGQNPINLSSQQQALLERIQSFISNGQEAGTLSIKNIQLPDQGSSLRNRLDHFSAQMQSIKADNNSSNASHLVKGDGFTALEEGMFAPTLRNRQQHLSGVRHDSTQQFYDAKTQTPNVVNESTNLTGNQKGDTMQQSGSGFNQMSSLNTTTATMGSFSMTNGSLLSPLTGQATDLTQTTMLPSGTVVQDQEVMQQLFERFQVNRRQLESKIQLRLHPVELGKMEIDLTVKEGSIRANVVAQSQHVQEIVERNIAKLRSVLEQQGLNVEEITVTSNAETVGGFDLFEQNLNRGDSSHLLSKNNKSETHTPFAIDDFQENYVENSTGVNVQA